MEKCNGLYRRDGKLVYIKQPEVNELNFIKELWSDYETMRDVGGTFELPKEKWELFYKKMISPTDGKNFYCLIYNYDNIPVGEVSFHGYDSATKIARFNIKVQNKFRNNGYGSEATRLMLEYYFNEFGGKMIMDTVENESGKNTIAKAGFEAIRKYGNKITYRLTKENFLKIHKAEKRRVGIMLYDNCDLLSVTTAYEIFSLANEEKEKSFDVFTLGANNGSVKTSVGMKLEIQYTLESIKELDILILPCINELEELLTNIDIMEFIKEHFDQLEVVLGMGTSSLLLAKSGFLEGLTVNIDGIYKEEFRNNINRVNWSNRSIVDNGRIILCNNVKATIEASLYIIKKLLGEEKSERILEILECKR